MPETRAQKRQRIQEALALPVDELAANDLSSLSKLEFFVAPVPGELQDSLVVEGLQPVSEAKRMALEPAASLIQRLRHHILRPGSNTLHQMVIIAMAVWGAVPKDERLVTGPPSFESIRRVVMREFPSLALHATDAGVCSKGSWGIVSTAQPSIIHLWEPLLLACGEMPIGAGVTISHVQAFTAVTVMHELMHTVTHRLCTASATPKAPGFKMRELGYNTEWLVLEGYLGVTWGTRPWDLQTALAMTTKVEVANHQSLQKVLVTKEWCDSFLEGLETDTLPKLSADELDAWRDPRGALSSRISQEISDNVLNHPPLLLDGADERCGRR